VRAHHFGCRACCPSFRGLLVCARALWVSQETNFFTCAVRKRVGRYRSSWPCQPRCAMHSDRECVVRLLKLCLRSSVPCETLRVQLPVGLSSEHSRTRLLRTIGRRPNSQGAITALFSSPTLAARGRYGPSFCTVFHAYASVRQILWLGSLDSHIPESVVTASRPGDIFVHRNIVNQVHTNDDSVLSVITYAVSVVSIEHGTPPSFFHHTQHNLAKLNLCSRPDGITQGIVMHILQVDPNLGKVS
jgi:hypothetical protein